MACCFAPFCDREFGLIVEIVVLWGMTHVSDFIF